MNKFHFILITLLALSSYSYPTERIFVAIDHPSDNGTAIDLVWDVKPFFMENPDKAETDFVEIEIFKQDSNDVWNAVHKEANVVGKFTDSDQIYPKQLYRYQLKIVLSAESDSVVFYVNATPTEQWFNYNKTPLLLMLIMLCSSILYYIIHAKRGKELFIRKINGLESMDEAVGRATEKGKPILFVPGIGDLDDIQTIAGLTILSKLAYSAATYNAELIVPVSKSMVLSTAREIVKEAHLKAGRPDTYKKDNIFYLTDDQFGYVAGIDGIMVREQPAANFFLGTFYAEALILAETGFGTGAMQTAGTAQPHQLPFFVVTCDYTLIGEELFAASAYLSKEPNQLGSLKGQDFGKIVIVVLIILGSVLETMGITWFKNFFMMD